MSPIPLSPVAKMSQPLRTASQDSADGIRKRVCKACDRCRLKKSKCDGSNPCSRCKADNAICVFGERKKSHDKVYPKGYVEMLEQQQSQLVSGLQEMYRRLVAADAWSGNTLSETNGNPLTHDILAALDLLETKQDGSGDFEMFEEDTTKLQSRLIAEGASLVQRRSSFSSDSDHSQHGQPHSASSGTPVTPRAPTFRDSFAFNSSASSPVTQSPAPRRPQSFPPAQPSPLQQNSPLSHNDPQFYQAEWSVPDMSSPGNIMRSKFAMHAIDQQGHLQDTESGLGNDQFELSSTYYDVSLGGLPMTSYSNQLSTTFGGGLQSMNDFGTAFEPMADADFSRYIQIMS